jgi:antitoxin Phd
MEAPMIPRYSVAEARNRFAELIHDLERMPQIEVTRRGRPVAVLVSAEEFERLRAGKVTFWSAYTAFRDTFDPAHAGIEPEVFEGLREPSPGRETSW